MRYTIYVTDPIVCPLVYGAAVVEFHMNVMNHSYFLLLYVDADGCSSGITISKVPFIWRST